MSAVVTVTASAKKRIDGVIRKIAYAITYDVNTSEELWDASRRATGIAEQMIEDWLENNRDQHPVNLKPVPLTFEAGQSRERQNRIMRAMNESYSIVQQGDEFIVTPLKSGSQYRVYVDAEKGQGYCTCRDFEARGISQRMPCKHIYAVLMNSEKATFIKKEV